MRGGEGSDPHRIIVITRIIMKLRLAPQKTYTSPPPGCRHRPRHHLLLRWSFPAWKGGDHRQQSGQPHHPLLCGLHRHREAHRRRGQEPAAAPSKVQAGLSPEGWCQDRGYRLASPQYLWASGPPSQQFLRLATRHPDWEGFITPQSAVPPPWDPSQQFLGNAT